MAEEISFKTKVLKGFLWLGTGTFLGQLISWLSTIFVIRLLSPSDYGLMAMASILISLLKTISELGIGASIIQAEQIKEREISQIFGFCIICGFFGFIVSYTTAPLIAAFFNEHKLVALIRFLSMNFIFMSLYIIPESSFVREMNFRKKAQIDIITQTGTAILTLVLALKSMGVWALASGAIAFHIFKAIGFNIAHASWIRPSFRFVGAEKFIKYGFTVTCSRLIYYLYTQSDKVIIGKFLGNNLLGYYAVALNLASIPMEKVLPIINQVSFSSYSRIQNDIERVRRNLSRATRVVAFSGFPLFLGMTAVAPDAIPLILGSKWAGIIVPFQLLCLTIPLKALNALFSPGVFAIGKPSVNLINITITFIFMTIAFLIGVKSGLLGICIAWLLAYPVIFVVTTINYLKILGIPLKQYGSEIRFPLIVSILMLSTLELLRQQTVAFHPLSSLIILVLFSMIFYFTLVAIFKKNEYLELKRLLQR